MCIYIYIYIYVYTHVHTYVYTHVLATPAPAELVADCRGRRENMVGVNMVLAQSIKFEHGPYKSCGT